MKYHAHGERYTRGRSAEDGQELKYYLESGELMTYFFRENSGESHSSSRHGGTAGLANEYDNVPTLRESQGRSTVLPYGFYRLLILSG
jgi:hypothetical protein